MTVISQPRYLPTLNYLQRFVFADEFIVLDSVQRQARDFENRNKLLLNGTPTWLTMPIASSSRAMIKDTDIAGTDWIDNHHQQIRSCYCNHPRFDGDLLATSYEAMKAAQEQSGNDFTETISACYRFWFDHFGLPFSIIRASEIEAENPGCPEKGPAKLLWLCQQRNANTYVSGPNGADYGIEDYFRDDTIPCVYHIHTPPQYPQPGQPEFVPWQGLYDSLFCMGRDWVKRELTSPPNLRKPDHHE